MKLVRYRRRSREQEAFGVLTGDDVVCIPELGKTVDKRTPGTLGELIELGDKGIHTIERLLRKTNRSDLLSASCKVRDVIFLKPIPKPPKIVCLGVNYRDHAAETNATIPKEPIIFMKPRTALIGPEENIVKPTFVRQLDYEAELAIIIGKRGQNIPTSEAMSHITGYTILNDVSARDIQFRDKQWTRGKSFDTFAPTGPCVTTRKQLPDTSDLSINTWVNGELRQASSTENMVLNVCKIVHHLSRAMTLEPQDIISTGTPAGVGFAQSTPKFLEAGDRIQIKIEGIGTLENTVSDP